MAKKTSKATPSFNDFFEEDLDLTESDEQEEETQEEEEVEKKKAQPKDKKKVKDEEEASGESEEEEKEEKKKPKSKEKPKKVEKEETKDESEEEESEENKEEETEEGSETSEVDPKTFFEEVDKITGLPVEVDFGEVDPLTPEGIALRDKAVRETAIDSFLTEIEETKPQLWRAMQHAYNNGDIAELFKEIAATRDYSKVTLGEEDEALATEIAKEYYKSKGIKNEARINKLIETAQESEEGIVGEAKPMLEEMKAEQAEKQQKVAEEQKKVAAESKKKEALLVGAIDEVLEKGLLSNFKLPVKEGKAFRDFIHSSVSKKDGEYAFSMKVEPTNLEKQLQYLFFQFRKGNIQDLVQMKKETKETGKLRLGISKEQALSKKSTEQEKKSNWSLKDYNEE